MDQVDPVCNATAPGSTGTVTTGILRSILSPKEDGPQERQDVAGATPHTADGSLSGGDGLRDVDDV